MSDIQCSFATSSSTTVDMITARLKKPVGFKGSPLFADDRNAHPETDRACSIRPESSDPENIAYTLKITDFTRCGVLKRNVCISSYSLFLNYYNYSNKMKKFEDIYQLTKEFNV